LINTLKLQRAAFIAFSKIPFFIAVFSSNSSLFIAEQDGLLLSFWKALFLLHTALISTSQRGDGQRKYFPQLVRKPSYYKLWATRRLWCRTSTNSFPFSHVKWNFYWGFHLESLLFKGKLWPGLMQKSPFFFFHFYYLELNMQFCRYEIMAVSANTISLKWLKHAHIGNQPYGILGISIRKTELTIKNLD